MSIRSMTGFGAGSAGIDGVTIQVELSSVNRKQLEAVFRLPQQLASSEVAVQKMVQSALSRGRVSGTVQMDVPAGEVSVSVDQARAAAVVETLRSSAKELGLADDLSATMLLKIPGLLTVQTAELPSEQLFSCLEEAMKEALEKLVAMRSLEGRALAEDLSGRLDALETMLEKIKELAPSVVLNRRAKMIQGLEKLGLDDLGSDERVLKEIALFGEKSDIAEEITRLASHIGQFRAGLGSVDPVGRELDFLVQEFLREINTVGSKANDLEITRQVVAFKTELERIREQVQNVE